MAEGIQNFGVRLEDADSTAITIADRNGRTLSGCRSALDYIKANHAEAIEDKGRTIIIINGSERVAIHFTRQILEMLSKDGYGGFIAGVGSTVPSLADISSSYAQSIAAISYHAYWEDRRIFTGDDISKDRPALSTSSLDIDKLKDLITRSDIEGIKDYMGNFFQALLFAKTPPPSYVKGMLLFLMNGIERGIAEAEDIELRQLEAARPDLADPMLLMDEIRSSVTGYFITISQTLLPEARLSSDRIIKECRKYVQERLYGRIAEDELLEDVEGVASGLSIAVGQILRGEFGEPSVALIERGERFQVKCVVAVGMVRIGAQEAIKLQNGAGRIIVLIVDVRQINLSLLGIGTERIASFELGIVVARHFPGAFADGRAGFGVKLIGGPIAGRIDFNGLQP